MKKTYLFVDGRNFRQYYSETVQKWFGQEVEFDFNNVKEHFYAEKAFYYDCVDDVRLQNETDEAFNNRVNSQEEKLNKIREIVGCHVYLGSLSGSGRKKRQKEVDVLLSVQMMEHAFRENMEKCVLLSGDKDYRPLVDSLVRLGLFVEVVGDRKHTSRDLILSADSHKLLTIDEYLKFAPTSIQNTRLVDFKNLSFFFDRADNDGFFLNREGVWEQTNVYLFSSNSREGTWFTTDNESIHQQSAWVSNDVDKIISYFELKYGEINWK